MPVHLLHVLICVKSLNQEVSIWKLKVIACERCQTGALCILPCPEEVILSFLLSKMMKIHEDLVCIYPISDFSLLYVLMKRKMTVNK